jgi:hypothetical protein
VKGQISGYRYEIRYGKPSTKGAETSVKTSSKQTDVVLERPDEKVARYSRYAAIHDIAARAPKGAEKDKRLGARCPSQKPDSVSLTPFLSLPDEDSPPF